MRAFREVLDECGLQDLGWSGMAYTWDNAQEGEANVKARLDRGFGNIAMLNLFTSITVKHIGAVESDHCFVMAKIRETADQGAGRARIFRYEDVWQTHSDYDQLVLDKWRCGQGGQRLQNVSHSLSALQQDLSSWGAKEFSCLSRKIRKLRDRLNRLHLRSMRRGPSAEEKDLCAQLRTVLKWEEIWMRHRSRVLWLRDGDRNTGYFQAQASQRRRINRIESLMRADGTRCSQPDEIQEEISSFYRQLYTTRAMRPARSENPQFQQVSELIDNYTGSWNIDLARQAFPTAEADAILNIPLSSEGGEDVLAWAPKKSGIYSVKTAYRSLMTQFELRALEEGTVTETPLSEQQIWARLWKLKVLLKVRVFWWRVLRGILPVESVLKHRHISNDSACKLFLNPYETLRHALMDCSHAMKFWDIAPEWLDVHRPDVNPQTWKTDILCDQRHSESDRAKLVSIMWSIWTSHNNITHDRGPVSPSQSMILTRDALAMLDIPRNQAGILPGHGWRPPDQDTIKINTDGSVAPQHSRSGGGGVARSKQGFIAAWCKPFGGVTDPLVAETLALREGAHFARLRGILKVILETYSLELVQLWHLRHNSRSVVAPILDVIGENVDFFSSFCVQHCNRAANMPAHLCAKQASIREVSECWMPSQPSFLVTCLQADFVAAFAE
ncbi:Alanyl-tRNA synthetase [Hordeum vulgare]|nr:Alanyl-tRNA synthetase [Hordeum vulgare]